MGSHGRLSLCWCTWQVYDCNANIFSYNMTYAIAIFWNGRVSCITKNVKFSKSRKHLSATKGRKEGGVHFTGFCCLASTRKTLLGTAWKHATLRGYKHKLVQFATKSQKNYQVGWLKGLRGIKPCQGHTHKIQSLHYIVLPWRGQGEEEGGNYVQERTLVESTQVVCVYILCSQWPIYSMHMSLTLGCSGLMMGRCSGFYPLTQTEK
jgi:hypothetical protein